MNELIENRKCDKCRQKMPVTEFFGAETTCRHCIRQGVREVSSKTAKSSGMVDKLMLERMEAMLNVIPSGGDENLPDQGTMVEDILRPFGGSRGLGMQFASTFLKAKPGGPVRQRMLATAMQHIKTATEMGYSKKPLELLSDEELDEYLEERARRVGLLESPDATEEETDS